MRKPAFAVTAAAGILASGAALADFPERTIENIFPWTQGAAMAASQIVAKAMGDELGESITIVSTPGAGGTKSFITAMGRPADGYTIIDGWVAPLVLQPVLGNADWTHADFKPLHAAHSVPFSVGLSADNTRWSTFEEVMAYCAEHPGELRYSTDARENLPHMVTARVLQAYNCVAQNIPYGTDGDAVKDLKAGVLDFAYVNPRAYLQEPEAFNMVLALTDSEEAAKTYGGAPNLTDLDIDIGISGLAPMGWTWWLVHPDTPDEETEILRNAMGAAMAREDVREQLRNIGFNPLSYGPDQYDAVVGPVREQLESMRNAIAWEEEQMKAQ
ncbi:Bug family tripartite tricarboxylate transporter substrate binding protein [Oceaniglobus trochenteri]|uniref:Bug family tripartite tricarboxylate transporter substrate binding protein n=1 Tax=Oceaniglobus trochenteri TaxID=2763260 RepID=UPI001CFF7AE7|nr:tripartite tricarboxylate transporter substrate-binding protein [Oceaniglobus trochenteri]